MGDNFIIYILAYAGDFEYHSLPLTFAPGFHHGAQICSSIEIISDTKAEGEEEFSVILNIGSRASVRLGNNVTTVVITDDDGMLYVAFLIITLLRTVFQSAVSFSIPASATAVEGGSAVAVCVEMTPMSTAATLAKDVIVTLTTVDGTGNYVHDIFEEGITFMHIRTATRDFSLHSVPLTFASGSAEGAELCASLTAYSDQIVESEEIFVIRLILVSSKESFFSLGNAEAAMYIIDSDCMLTSMS